MIFEPLSRQKEINVANLYDLQFLYYCTHFPILKIAVWPKRLCYDLDFFLCIQYMNEISGSASLFLLMFEYCLQVNSILNLKNS